MFSLSTAETRSLERRPTRPCRRRMQLQSCGRTGTRRQQGCIDVQLESIAAFAVNGQENGFWPGGNSGSAVARAASSGVTVDHVDSVPLRQPSGPDNDPNHEDVALTSTIQRHLGVLDQPHGCFRFNAGQQLHAPVSSRGADVVFLCRISGLQPIRRVTRSECQSSGNCTRIPPPVSIPSRPTT